MPSPNQSVAYMIALIYCYVISHICLYEGRLSLLRESSVSEIGIAKTVNPFGAIPAKLPPSGDKTIIKSWPEIQPLLPLWARPILCCTYLSQRALVQRCWFSFLLDSSFPRVFLVR